MPAACICLAAGAETSVLQKMLFPYRYLTKGKHTLILVSGIKPRPTGISETELGYRKSFVYSILVAWLNTTAIGS